MTKRPAGPVVAVRTSPVDSFVADTVTPGTTPLEASRTLPPIVPVVCASAGAASGARHSSTAASTTRGTIRRHSFRGNRTSYDNDSVSMVTRAVIVVVVAALYLLHQ